MLRNDLSGNDLAVKKWAIRAQKEEIKKEIFRRKKTDTLTIKCGDCNKVFYYGTVEHFLATRTPGIPREFHVLAMAHRWDTNHKIIFESNDPEVTEQILKIIDINAEVDKLKLRIPIGQEGKPFMFFWNGSRGVKCTTCGNSYYGIESIKQAVKCHELTKVFPLPMPKPA